MTSLRYTDPIAATRPYLAAYAPLAAEVGVPLDRLGHHISAHNEPPYPRIRLSDPPGFDRDLRHLLAPLLQVEVLGDLDGTHGKPLLRSILYTALEALRAIPDTEQIDPTLPVITAVTSSGGGGWSPEPTGQSRYLATVTIHLHAPFAPAD